MIRAVSFCILHSRRSCFIFMNCWSSLCGKKRPVFFFVLVSTSGASNWQACKDSHWNNRTTFVFHKIVIYNSWIWKQSEDSLKISLTAKPARSLQMFKSFFCYGMRLRTKSIITFLIVSFSCLKQQKMLGILSFKGFTDWEREATIKASHKSS